MKRGPRRAQQRRSPMKRLAVLALTVALAPLAGAQLYKYTDKDGKTVYTDQPPPTAESKAIRVQPSGGPAPAPAAAAGKPGDKAAQKGGEAQKDSAKKAEDAAKNAAAKEANCNTAKVQYQNYQDGGRIYKYNAAGEREFMSDADIEAARVRSKREMDEACKP
jgi:hypothetical protein